MTSNRLILTLFLTAVWVVPVHGQGENDLKTYGYLQASLYQETHDDEHPDANTFIVQQLDIMFQRNLSQHWSAFVDLLFTNSYDSFRNSGDLDIEQAWVRYRKDHYLNIKMGLLIPWFNYLNEIRNKMPILPYIIRPIVYETSFQEDIDIDEYVPKRAYVQAYGFAPAGEYKMEYAGYVGNSPNTNTDSQFGPTGFDTTSSLMVGARVGVRHSYFQFGVSATHDRVNYLSGFEEADSLTPLEFNDVQRVRIGSDVRFEYQNLSFEGEYIAVEYDDGHPIVDVDKRFAYGTLGYRFIERLFVYGGYWEVRENLAARTAAGPDTFLTAKAKLKIPTSGVTYQMSDRIVFKGAVAHVIQDYADVLPTSRFNFYTVAVSVTF